MLGGTVASAISKPLHLNENTRRILSVCGMGATFSAVFGTPLGACIFVLEAIKNIQLALFSAVPALISSTPHMQSLIFSARLPKGLKLALFPISTFPFCGVQL